MALFVPGPWTMERAWFEFLDLLLVYVLIRTSRAMYGWIRHFRLHFLIVEDGGVRFRLPGTSEVLVPWREIESLTCERRWITARSFFSFGYRLDAYRIAARHGSFTFTAMEIPGARRAARVIAKRIECQVPECHGQPARTPA